MLTICLALTFLAVCQPGYYRQGVTCQACAVGFYQNETEFTGDECTACPRFSDEFNSTTDGTATASGDDCKADCPLGYEREDSVRCVECPANKYGGSGDDRCEECKTDFGTNGRTGQTMASDCDYRICSPGEENDPSDSTICIPCPLNKYNELRDGMCTDCGGGRITKETGSNSIAECIIDCPSGEEFNSTLNTCVRCPAGEYRTRGESFTCQACADTTKIPNAQATACDTAKCDAGQYPMTNTEGASVCVPCPLDEYQPNEGQLACISCADDLYTAQTGSTDKNQCQARPRCSDNSCTENESCKNVNTTRGFECSCLSAYDDVNGQCTHVCDRETPFCQNSASCDSSTKDLSFICICTADWSGVNCTDAKAGGFSDRDKIIIAGVVSGVVLLVVVVAAVVGCAKSLPGAAGAAAAPKYLAPAPAGMVSALPYTANSPQPVTFYDSVPRNMAPAIENRGGSGAIYIE